VELISGGLGAVCMTLRHGFQPLPGSQTSIPPPAAAVAESSGARPEKNARQKSVNKRLYNDWTKRFEYLYQ